MPSGKDPIGVEPTRRADFRLPELRVDGGGPTSPELSHADRVGSRRKTPTPTKGSHARTHRGVAGILANSPQGRKEREEISRLEDQLFADVDRIGEEAATKDSDSGYKGKLSPAARRNFRKFVESLEKQEDRRAVLEALKEVAEGEEEETITDDVTTVLPGGVAPPTMAVPPVAIAPSTAPLATAPSSVSADSSKASAPDTAATPAPGGARKKKKFFEPAKFEYHDPHHCNLALWLATSLLAKETTLITDAGISIVKSILTELNASHGGKGQFGTIIEIFDLASNFFKTFTDGISQLLHKQLDAVAKQCLEEGHITKDDYKYIHNKLVKPVLKDVSGFKSPDDKAIDAMAKKGEEKPVVDVGVSDYEDGSPLNEPGPIAPHGFPER